MAAGEVEAAEEAGGYPKEEGPEEQTVESLSSGVGSDVSDFKGSMLRAERRLKTGNRTDWARIVR